MGSKKLAWEKKAKPLKWAKQNTWLADESNAHLYHSTRWRKLRKSLLIQNPICETPGCTQPSKYCDHIIPYKKGMDFFDESNLQMLCPSCNASKTASQK